MYDNLFIEPSVQLFMLNYPNLLIFCKKEKVPLLKNLQILIMWLFGHIP